MSTVTANRSTSSEAARRRMIADRIRNNIRDLEGCLVRLLAVASLSHQDVTLELAEEVLLHYVNPEPDQLTPERVIAVVSERFSVKAEKDAEEQLLLKVKYYLEDYPEPQIVMFDLINGSHVEAIDWPPIK